MGLPEGESVYACVCLSVCLSAPEREERESAMEKAVEHLTPDSKGLFTWCPGWGWGTAAALSTQRAGWGGGGWMEKESEGERLCGWERM